MPAVSKKQQEAMAIAEHAPEKLYARNKGLLKMSQGQLHDFAATKRSGLPAKAHIDRGHANVRNAKTHAHKLKHG